MRDDDEESVNLYSDEDNRNNVNESDSSKDNSVDKEKDNGKDYEKDYEVDTGIEDKDGSSTEEEEGQIKDYSLDYRQSLWAQQRQHNQQRDRDREREQKRQQEREQHHTLNLPIIQQSQSPASLQLQLPPNPFQQQQPQPISHLFNVFQPPFYHSGFLFTNTQQIQSLSPINPIITPYYAANTTSANIPNWSRTSSFSVTNGLTSNSSPNANIAADIDPATALLKLDAQYIPLASLIRLPVQTQLQTLLRLPPDEASKLRALIAQLLAKFSPSHLQTMGLAPDLIVSCFTIPASTPPAPISISIPAPSRQQLPQRQLLQNFPKKASPSKQKHLGQKQKSQQSQKVQQKKSYLQQSPQRRQNEIISQTRKQKKVAQMQRDIQSIAAIEPDSTAATSSSSSAIIHASSLITSAATTTTSLLRSYRVAKKQANKEDRLISLVDNARTLGIPEPVKMSKKAERQLTQNVARVYNRTDDFGVNGTILSSSVTSIKTEADLQTLVSDFSGTRAGESNGNLSKTDTILPGMAESSQILQDGFKLHELDKQKTKSDPPMSLLEKLRSTLRASKLSVVTTPTSNFEKSESSASLPLNQTSEEVQERESSESDMEISESDEQFPENSEKIKSEKPSSLGRLSKTESEADTLDEYSSSSESSNIAKNWRTKLSSFNNTSNLVTPALSSSPNSSNSIVKTEAPSDLHTLTNGFSHKIDNAPFISAQAAIWARQNRPTAADLNLRLNSPKPSSADMSSPQSSVTSPSPLQSLTSRRAFIPPNPSNRVTPFIVSEDEDEDSDGDSSVVDDDKKVDEKSAVANNSGGESNEQKTKLAVKTLTLEEKIRKMKEAIAAKEAEKAATRKKNEIDQALGSIDSLASPLPPSSPVPGVAVGGEGSVSCSKGEISQMKEENPSELKPEINGDVEMSDRKSETKDHNDGVGNRFGNVVILPASVANPQITASSSLMVASIISPQTPQPVIAVLQKPSSLKEKTPTHLDSPSNPSSPRVSASLPTSAVNNTLEYPSNPSSPRAVTSALSSTSATKNTLESQIAADEALLASALGNIATLESQLPVLTKTVEHLDAQLETQKSEIAKLEENLAVARTGLIQTEREREDVGNTLANAKKTILLKVSAAGNLRGALNGRRMQLLEVSQKLKKEQRMKDKLRKEQTQQQVIVPQQQQQKYGKRVGTIQGGDYKRAKIETKMQQVIVSEDDFIRFGDMDVDGLESGDGETLEPAAFRNVNESVSATVDREEKFSRIVWEQETTVDRLYVIGGCLVKMSEVCRLSDLYGSNVPLDDGLGQIKSQKTSTVAGFVPFESPLIQFRSYRYFNLLQNGESVVAKQLGLGNKIDVFKVMCKNETADIACNDPACSGQHFRDSSLSENEVVLDLLAHLESDPNINVAEVRALIQQSRGKGTTYDDIVRLIIDFRNAHAKDHTVVFKSANGAVCKALNEQLNPGGNNVFRDAHAVVVHQEYPPFLLPTNQPIFLKGIQRVCDGEKAKFERYFEIPLEESEHKAMIERDPKNVSLRISYAHSLLPSMLSAKEFRKTNKDIVACIDVLVEAVEQINNSEELWMFYIELYMRRAKDDDVRDIFEQGLGFIPNCVAFWWRFFLWEIDVDAKETLLKRMLFKFLDDDCLIDSCLRSSTVLAVVVQLAKLYLDYDVQKKSGRVFLHTFLGARKFLDIEKFSSNSRADKNSLHPFTEYLHCKVLTVSDLAKIWLIYLHLTYHGTLPTGIFYNYPYDHLIRQEYFLLKFGKDIANAIHTPSGVDMIWFKQLFQNCIHAWDVYVEECSSAFHEKASVPYLAIFKNYVEFISLRSKSSRVERLVSNAIESKPWCKGLLLLSVKLNNYSIPVGEFGLVNKWVKDLFAADSKKQSLKVVSPAASKAVELLVNSIRVCFSGLEKIDLVADLENIVTVREEAMKLYEKALGLSVNIQTPDFSPYIKASSSYSSLKPNVYLWLNYLMLQSIQFFETGHSNVRHAFEQALEVVKSRDDRILLWNEYLTFEIRHVVGEVYKRVLVVLWRAVDDLGAPSDSPIGGSKDGIDGICGLVSVKDFRDCAQMLLRLVSLLPREKAAEILDMMNKTHFAKYYFEADAVESGKNILSGALRMNAKSLWIWQLIYAVENLGGQFGNTKTVQRICDYAAEIFGALYAKNIVQMTGEKDTDDDVIATTLTK
ncbi:Zinc finger C3H1 domain-containing protein [Physocladia obscura]|uniref:Zinc finger C3H1 domain-containing protein n=1 Tax=Physocladia obscura TaxID=109957 RepID=A0AAD5SWS9_9FUNG|nr:Zinc finger C3H1 domain-containing protein [Physocladia obscura]